jgi:hypothetical protein
VRGSGHINAIALYGTQPPDTETEVVRQDHDELSGRSSLAKDALHLKQLHFVRLNKGLHHHYLQTVTLKEPWLFLPVERLSADIKLTAYNHAQLEVRYSKANIGPRLAHGFQVSIYIYIYITELYKKRSEGQQVKRINIFNCITQE